MSSLIAYHGQQSIKDKYIARMQEHVRQDQLIQGTGWEDGKGCAVGCTFDSYDHSRGPEEIGVPEVLLHLEDVIFEGLSSDLAAQWPLRFLSAIRPGSDLSRVHHQFFAWLLLDSGLLTLIDCTRGAVGLTASLHVRAAAGEPVTSYEWSEARSAAEAARSAARSARSARSTWSAAEAARSAAKSARSARSTWSAADSAEAARSAARSAAWSARSAWQLMADKLESLLTSA
jgi:hypothetical protein